MEADARSDYLKTKTPEFQRLSVEFGLLPHPNPLPLGEGVLR